MEMFYGDDFGEKGDLPHKCEDDGLIDTALAKFDGMLRSGVTGKEKDELSEEPALDDFAVGTGM